MLTSLIVLSFTCILSIPSLYKNLSKRKGQVQSGYHSYLSKCSLFLPSYSYTIVHLTLNKNHSLTLYSNSIMERVFWSFRFLKSLISENHWFYMCNTY